MPQVVKTHVVHQDTFPGAWIEPEWSRLDAIKNAPHYALRLSMNPKIILSPKGQDQYVSMTFEGWEFILHKTNYEIVKNLSSLFVSGFLNPKGFDLLAKSDLGNKLRYSPELVISGLQWLSNQASQTLEIPFEKVRMLWIQPDQGACGFYRSQLPYLYMEENFKNTFYAESREFANFSSMGWFDVFINHRVPPPSLLSIFQQLVASDRTLIYEADDDFFNIPSWNFNSDVVNSESIKRARVSAEIADLLVVTTEELINVFEHPDKTMLGPNLVNVDGGPLLCNRKVQDGYKGYRPRRNNQKVEFVSTGNKPTIHEIGDDYDPIRILWAGSNTHDKDLQQVCSAITKLGNEYGMAIRFFFFGYCPAVFLEAYAKQGNTEPQYRVKAEYAHYIDFIPPVPFNDYYAGVRQLDPDFAICPLTADPFNLSKSNLKVLEFGALGIPCVVSNFGPYKFLEGSDFALSVPTRDPRTMTDDWYALIKSFIEWPQQRAETGLRWHNEVKKNYSWASDSPNRRLWDNVFGKIRDIALEKRGKFNYLQPSELYV